MKNKLNIELIKLLWDKTPEKLMTTLNAKPFNEICLLENYNANSLLISTTGEFYSEIVDNTSSEVKQLTEPLKASKMLFYLTLELEVKHEELNKVFPHSFEQFCKNLKAVLQ